jgi:hypothetical protein
VIRFRLLVKRTWTDRFEDYDGRLSLHLRRAELIQEIVDAFGLNVIDWGETHVPYPREKVLVELEAPSRAVVQEVIERARKLVRAGQLLDVLVTVEQDPEFSVRESGRSSSKPRGGLFGEPTPVMRNGGGPHDDHPPAMANGGGPSGDDLETANGGGPSAQPPAMANGGGPSGNGSPTRPRRPRRRRVVSSGFAEPERRMDPLTGKEPLRRGYDYLYWVEVAEKPIKGSIEETHVELVPKETLKEGAEFVVALFAFPDELRVDEERSVGTLRYRGDGRLVVWRQPGGEPRKGGLYDPDVEYRMFFPITTPNEAGRARLRCNIYFRGVLVQSRLVTAHVGKLPKGRSAGSAVVDFQLAQLDSPDQLAPIQPHALSLQVNSNGAATHSFRFASFTDGEPEFKNDAVLSANELQDLITQGRGAMRKVAWGAMTPWKDGTQFRYTAPPFPDLATDIFELMRKGRQLYGAIINELAAGPMGAKALRQRMRAPGRVQVVNSGSPSELIPTSLVYDYVNTDPALGNMTLCPAFAEARGGNKPLEETPCFKGKCPSIDVDQVVCPSGFWGYRHAIGIPVRSKWGAPPPLRMTFEGSPSLGIAFFPGFDLVAAHRQHIADQNPGWEMLEPADTYSEALAMLKARPNVVYFYCHGGTSTGNAPYLLVGSDKKQPMFPSSLIPGDDDNLDLYRLPRSLIILNGCETNALEPNRAMKFVSSFVDNIAASGVIGTEITTSEELAVAFGEALLRNLRGSVEVGESIRRARLALLQDGNPLGLIYLPLVPADAVLAEA